MPCFGGPDLRTLFITSHRENLPEGAPAEAGSLMILPSPVAGARVHRFRDR